MNTDWEAQRKWRQGCEDQWGAPEYIDLWDFVHNGRELRGVMPVRKFPRLLEGLPEQPLVESMQDLRADGKGAVWFEIQGYTKVGQRSGLRLKVQARIDLVCQRCLDIMCLDVLEQAEFDVVTQAQMDQMDQEELDPDEPEMLVGSRQFDLFELIEDQLILAVPYVPKHDNCGKQQGASSDRSVNDMDPEQVDAKRNPFEVLKRLKGQQ